MCDFLSLANNLIIVLVKGRSNYSIKNMKRFDLKFCARFVCQEKPNEIVVQNNAKYNFKLPDFFLLLKAICRSIKKLKAINKSSNIFYMTLKKDLQ